MYIDENAKTFVVLKLVAQKLTKTQKKSSNFIFLTDF